LYFAAFEIEIAALKQNYKKPSLESAAVFEEISLAGRLHPQKNKFVLLSIEVPKR
jgi:hypothetical protein